MQDVGESLGQHDGQGLHQVRPDIVPGLALAPGQLQHALAAGHGQQRRIVLAPAPGRRGEIREAELFPGGLARETKNGRLFAPGAVKEQVIAGAVHREEPVNAAGFDEPFFYYLVLQPGQQGLGLAGLFLLVLLQLQEAQVEQVLVDILEQLAERLLSGEMPLQVRRDRDIVGETGARHKGFTLTRAST